MDCIDRGEAMNLLNEAQVEYDENYKGLGLAKKIISDMKPTNPERPKGEWKYTDEVHEIARCSKCSFLIDASGCVDPEEYISIYRYCPHCGADMRG